MKKPESFYIPVQKLNAILPANQILMFAVTVNIEHYWFALIRTPQFEITDPITEQIIDLAETLRFLADEIDYSAVLGNSLNSMLPDNQLLMFGVAMDLNNRQFVFIRAPKFAVPKETSDKISDIAKLVAFQENSKLINYLF
jgi:hypothetical protein